MLPTMSTAPALAPCGGGGLGRRPSPRGVAGHGARWPIKSSRPNRSPSLGPAADTGVAGIGREPDARRPHPARPSAESARTKLLLEGPVLPTLLRLAAPNVLNLLAFVGVITFDGFFLGRIGTDALAGASLAFPWVMLVLQTTNSGMGAGVSSAVARALGVGRRERADDLVFHAFLLA